MTTPRADAELPPGRWMPAWRCVLRGALVATLVAIGANALLYAGKAANPLIGADAWYFVGTLVRKAAAGHVGLADLFAKRSAFDHSQPLRKLVLLFHYRVFDLDFGIEAVIGVLAAFVNLALLWAIVRPATRGRYPATGACAFAAIAAVYLSLNASVVFDWPLLTLAYTGHAFVLCFLLACWWAFRETSVPRLVLLAVAALAMDVVVDDTGLVATIAATLAVVVAGRREGGWRRPLPIVLTVSMVYLAYALAWHWMSASQAMAGGVAQPRLGALLQSMWQRMDGTQSALLAPFSAAIVHPMQMRVFGPRAGAASMAIASMVILAHAWFWWCAWRGRRNRAAFVATALMLLFYGLVAGILVVRVSTHALSYLWQPRYVVIYQWNVVALLLMGASQLPAADEADTARWRRWPVVLGGAAVALLALQVPLSVHTWSGVRYRSVNQQRAALALGALARRAEHDRAAPATLEDCRLHPQCRTEIARFLKENRLNIFSPAFQARNRLYPDARALPRVRPQRTRGGVQDLVEPVVQPHP